MPSPFPGMDPYLEGSEWTSVHTELSSEIARQLAPQLRPKYVARTTRRFVTDLPEDVSISVGDLYPDIGVFHARPLREALTAGAAIAATPAPLRMTTVTPSRAPEVTVEIRDVANRALVTAIEVLSPTNKRGEGYREYLDKRERLLNSAAHLIEIDLLRAGRRVPMKEPLPDAPYFVFLSRAERRPILEVWPIQLSDPLPAVPVPLLPNDPDVTLDLQRALNTIYDALNYDLSVNYARPPEMPLPEAAARWATERLRAAGLTPHP